MPDREFPHEFKPVISGRRSEIYGWLLVVLMGGAWWTMGRQGISYAGFILLFFFVFLILAAGTSLANWMERRTLLRLTPDHIHFENGLRNVTLSWDEIREVQVLPTRRGQSVEIVGRNRHFHFQIARDVEVLGTVLGRVGFADGKQILAEILSHTELQKIERSQPGRYYTRG
jgi:hypothetical protein